MALLSLVRVDSGEVGVKPGTVKMLDTANLATITAAGYIKNSSNSPAKLIGLGQNDVIECLYSYNTSNGSGTLGYFQPSIADGVITLNNWENPGNVLLPVVDGDFANFNGTTGQIEDTGFSPTDPAKTKVVMLNATPTIGRIANFSSGNGTIGDSGLATNVVLYSTITTPDVNINMVRFDVTVTAAALASGAAVALITSSGSKQYKLCSLWVNSGGTNFSGGGGDRLLSISDGTTVYSVIPAATLGTLVNAGWGIGADLPFPASAAINTSTAAGQNLRAIYSGGAADYAAGSVVISGLAQRVA